MRENESELLEQARQGSPGAFETLIRPHLAQVRRFAFLFAHDWQDADDIAQEALIKAFRSIDKFSGRSSFSTWLYSVTRNVCIDWYRSRMTKARGVEEELEDRHPASLDGQDLLLERRIGAERLWRAIKMLDAEFRLPVVLHAIEGMPCEEIARIEHVPVGTVRSRLSRARTKLRAILSADDELPGSEQGADGAQTSSDPPGRPR